MCLHNAVEVSFLTTYIKKFWTQVCGQFAILTLHGTEKKVWLHLSRQQSGENGGKRGR